MKMKQLTPYLVAILIGASWLVFMIVIEIVFLNLSVDKNPIITPINGLTTIVVGVIFFNFIKQNIAKNITKEKEIDTALEKTLNSPVINSIYTSNLEKKGENKKTIKATDNNGIRKNTKTVIKMKLSIKFITIIVLIMTTIIGLYALDEWLSIYLLEFLDEVIIAFVVVDILFIIFLTTALLISPQLIIKNSLEFYELIMKDKLLKAKLAVLKKEKELLDIQKDINNLKSENNFDKL